MSRHESRQPGPELQVERITLRRTEGTGHPRKKQKKHRRGILRRILKWFFVMLLLILLTGGISAAVTVRSIIAKAPDLTTVSVAPAEEATYILNSEGKRIQKLTLPEANRDLVSLERIPACLQHAFVAIEDSRFYRHNGIDLPGIFRALLIGIRSGSFSEGASTITQQLLKNTVFTDWTRESSFRQRLTRKIQEQYLALQLEKILTKDQILEDYLNMINLGAGCYGVQAAAYRYFGKDVSDLTLSESAVIASITQNPTRYNPIVNPENNRARRDTVLAYMLRQEYITTAEYEEALADDVYARIQSNEDSRDTASSIYTFYQDALIDQVMQDLMDEKGYTWKQAYKAVYTGGLRIYSAQDDAIQKICDEEFANPANFPENAGFGIDYALSVETPEGEVTHYGNDDLRGWIRSTEDPSFNMLFESAEQAKEAASRFKSARLGDNDTLLGERITVTSQPQASIVIMDQETGYVKAIVGGRGEKEASLTLNRATYTTRQPGSTFKVLTAFAPALDAKGQTLATVYDNGTFTYDNGMKVSNWDVSDYGGKATIHEAIVRSINVVAVECITAITPKLGYEYAKRMGISSLTDHYVSGNEVLSDVVQPLALGGITKGVSNLELCGAYACIANRGVYMRPMFYTKVEDYAGNTLLDASAPAGRTALKSSTASLLTWAMEDVIRDERGTAHNYIDLQSMPVAGKTGTTSDYRDIWFAGYTPYYTCCVWGGYDNNDCLPDSDLGHHYSQVLWNTVMNRVHEELPIKQFPFAGDVIRFAICTESGEAADADCPATYDELFALGTQPDRYCPVHGSGLPVRTISTGGAAAGGESTLGGVDSSAITITTADSFQGNPEGLTPLQQPGQQTGQQPGQQAGQTPADPFSQQGDQDAIVIISSDQASIPAPQNSQQQNSQWQDPQPQDSQWQDPQWQDSQSQSAWEQSFQWPDSQDQNQNAGTGGGADVPDIVILN